MSDFLCLRFKEIAINSLSKVAWSVLATDGHIESSGYALLQDIPQVVPTAGGTRRNIVIVPSGAVLLTSVDVPSKQHRHLKQLLAFVVEEQIIDPIESMHLATPAFHTGDEVRVAALRRDTLEDWLEALEQIDFLPDYLFVDVLCVPQKVGDWQLLFEENKLLYRDGGVSGLTLDKNTAEPVIRLAIDHLHSTDGENSSADTGGAVGDSVIEVVLLSVAAEDLSELARLSLEIQEISDRQAEPDSGALDEFSESDSLDNIKLDPVQTSAGQQQVEPAELDPDLMIVAGAFKTEIGDFIRSENIETRDVEYSETASQLLAVNAVHSLETTLNLLQGEFRPISASAENRRFIRKAGAAVAVCLSLFLVITLAGGFYLNYRADKYFDDSIAIYKSLFPKQRRIYDPVKQMRQQLSGHSVAGATSEFLPLLDAASKSLANLDSENPATITQLRYDSQRGHITIEIRAKDIDELEAYKDLLTGEGLKVDILSANQDNDIVTGRIKIGRG